MKRIKTGEQTSESNNTWEVDDRLSYLPNAIILHILSFVDTKLAVQTTILSKRWLHVWKYLPSLNIYTRSFPHKSSFERFISQFLINHKSLVVDSMIFHDLPPLDESMSIVGRVIRHVASRQVEHVDLKFLSPTDATKYIPLASKSLKTLKLDGYFLTLTSLKLPSLKTLHLNFVYIQFDEDDPLIKNLLRCPSLEVLNVCRCFIYHSALTSYKFSSLMTLSLHKTDISNPPYDMFSAFLNLENLEISNCMISHSYNAFVISCPKLINLEFLHVRLCCARKLIISAPKLVSFEFEYTSSFFCCGELELVSPASLQTVDFWNTNPKKCYCPVCPPTTKKSREDRFLMIINLFKGLSSVKSLYLSSDIIKVLILFTDMLENKICPLDNLEILKVQKLGSKKVEKFQIPPEVFQYLSSGSPNLKEVGFR